MGIKANVANGVSPVWTSIPNGTGWIIDPDAQATAFFVEFAGNVAFQTNNNPTWIIRSFPDAYVFVGDFTAIGTTAQGTSATGLLIGTTG